MAVIFLEPGGEFYFGVGTGARWPVSLGFPSIVNNAPAGRQAASDGKFYAFKGGSSMSKNLGNNYSHMVFGFAMYFDIPPIGKTIFQSTDAGTVQVDIRTDGTGHTFLTRNGTTIGSVSTTVVNQGWNYFELDVLYSTTTTGSAQCWLNSVSVVNATSVQTANTANAFANGFTILFPDISCLFRDVYVLDATTGTNTTHLGDVTVGVEYATTAGAHSQWAETIGGTGGGTLTLTSVNTSGVYQFSTTGVTANQLIGLTISVTGFTNGANNITLLAITANTTSSFTVSGITTVSETHAATATPQNLVQDGINHLGTWPDGDNGYIIDSTANDISDFGHTSLSLTGTLYAVGHLSYVRKDDAGARLFRQVCISGGTTETNGSDIPLTNSYLYYDDYLDQDPQSGGISWTTSNYNAATFGVKEVT